MKYIDDKIIMIVLHIELMCTIALWPLVFFELQVEILSQLEHPNIIEFYGEASGPNSQYVIVTGKPILIWLCNMEVIHKKNKANVCA